MVFFILDINSTFQTPCDLIMRIFIFLIYIIYILNKIKKLKVERDIKKIKN